MNDLQYFQYLRDSAAEFEVQAAGLRQDVDAYDRGEMETSVGPERSNITAQDRARDLDEAEHLEKTAARFRVEAAILATRWRKKDGS